MLSLPKILLLLVVVIAVVYGTRLLRGFTRGGPPADAGTAGGTGRAGGDGAAVDLVACGPCGNYVDPQAGGCERADCPYT